MVKNYLNISELSIRLNLINKKTGKPLNHILRFWEKEFSEIKPVILKGNRRYYNQKQVEELSLEERLKTDPFALGEFSKETKKRRENPFLDIIGQLGDFTGLTRENIKQGWESGRARARMYDETKRIFKYGADLSDAEYQNYINLALKSGELSEIDSFKRWSDTYDSYISGGENWATSTMMAIKEEGTGGLLAVMLQSFAGLTHKEILAAGGGLAIGRAPV